EPVRLWHGDARCRWTIRRFAPALHARWPALRGVLPASLAEAVHWFDVSGDGTLAVLAGRDALRVMELPSRRLAARERVPHGPVRDVCMAASGTLLLCLCLNRCASLLALRYPFSSSNGRRGSRTAAPM